jgi:hypothetical protein
MCKKRYRWINVYAIEREYGGPEEGGWWYNTYDCLTSIRVKTRKQEEEARRLLEEEYLDLKWGNIYSVLGGTDIRIRREKRRAESHDMSRPYYC